MKVNIKKKKKGKGEEYFYQDAMILNEDSFFNSLDIIINNSSWTPEYLKKVYIIEFLKILKSVGKKIKREAELNK